MSPDIFGTEVILPSKGLPYEGKIPDGRVVVSPMTTKEETLFASANPANMTHAINALISRCVPAVNELGVDNLLVNDQAYLLMMIRAASFGHDYQFDVKCGNCDLRFKHSVDIPNDFTTYYLKDDFVEPFYVNLPVSKARVGLRLLRGKDERAIQRYSETAYKKSGQKTTGDNTYSYRFARHIVSIESDKLTHRTEKGTLDEDIRAMEFFESLYVKDSAAIRQAITDNDCGLDTELNFPCPRCDNDIRTFMPYQIEFFRPGGRRSS